MNVDELADRMEGEVLEASDDGYVQHAEVWNARFLRAPDAVARCTSAADVIAGVEHARNSGVPLGVKGGGHSYAGHTVPSEGVLLDLSPLKDIVIDIDDRLAIVGAGVTCAELDAAAQEHGLATPVPTVSSVGVIGAMLGGGSGWLSRRYGLTLDNLVSADVVTTDGRHLTVSADQHPDLFWGLRGAGANLGIVISATLKLHPIGTQVLAGQIIYPFERARELLRAYREFMADTPRAVCAYPFMFRIPPIPDFPEELHGDPVIDFVVANQDPNGMSAIQPLRELGDPILDAVAPAPYTALQQSFDANLPKGQRYYSKAHQLDALSDEAIDVVVQHVPNMAGEFTAAYFEPLGEAIADVDRSATAYWGREAAYGFHALGGWSDAGDDEKVMTWVRGIHEAMADHATGGVYVNLIAEDGDDRIPDAYGGNYERVRSLKATWEPDNLLRHNHNIPPA